MCEGGDNALAAEYISSWTALLDEYADIPEEIDSATAAVVCPVNELRPECANRAFDVYWHTGDLFYRTGAWRYFPNLTAHHRVPNGYTITTAMTKRPWRRATTSGLFLRRNFKWLYPTFSATARFDHDNGCLSADGKGSAKIAAQCARMPVTVRAG